MTGIWDRPGMSKRSEIPKMNLLDDCPPVKALFIAVVRKVVSATAKILTTTPLMTWLARNFTHSRA